MWHVHTACWPVFQFIFASFVSLALFSYFLILFHFISPNYFVPFFTLYIIYFPFDFNNVPMTLLNTVSSCTLYCLYVLHIFLNPPLCNFPRVSTLLHVYLPLWSPFLLILCSVTERSCYLANYNDG